MPINKNKLSASIALVAAGVMHPTYADFHLWRISELFTSSDGAVQYIELQTDASGPGNLSGQSIVATDASGQQQNNVVLSSNLTGETANSNVLIATQAFVDLTGLSADFIIEAGFVFTEGGSINFANGTAILNYAASQLPKNGVQSIDGNVEPEKPSPTNFIGLDANNISVDIRAS